MLSYIFEISQIIVPNEAGYGSTLTTNHIREYILVSGTEALTRSLPALTNSI
jgi:hypothetical protein